MNCKLCHRKARDEEAFWSLSWERIDVAEFNKRVKDGRTTWINEVCSDCIAKYNNSRPPLGLNDLNNIRKRRITEEQFYREHGYKTSPADSGKN